MDALDKPCEDLPESPSQHVVLKQWNQSLAQQAVLPEFLPGLSEYVKAAGLKDDETTALTRAIVECAAAGDAGSRIASAEVKDALRRNTDEAIARGVFGVPTLAVGDELFWGVDATAMAADYVLAGCRYDDPEYARVSALPVGASREARPAKGAVAKRRTRIVGTAG